MLADLYRGAIVADVHRELLLAISARPPESWVCSARRRWLPRLGRAGAARQAPPRELAV